jgi:hypothetical protein
VLATLSIDNEFADGPISLYHGRVDCDYCLISGCSQNAFYVGVEFIVNFDSIKSVMAFIGRFLRKYFGN